MIDVNKTKYLAKLSNLFNNLFNKEKIKRKT